MSDKWQPIETAPKSESVIGFNGEVVTEMFWADYEDDDDYIGWCCAGFSDGGMLFFYHNAFKPAPTHWMPLPKPPNPPINNHP